MNNKGKGGQIWIWIIVAVVALFLFGVIKLPSLGTGVGGDTTIATYAADASYATINAFSTEAVGGTAYYAEKGGIFQTSAPKLERDGEYEYWVSNSTVYVKPIAFTATGSNNVINKVAYRTGSPTITAWDTTYSCAVNTDVAVDACNMTLGANQQS
jgi:hypothetical protein